MKTLVEIADTLGLPASTVRYYAKHFREFLPTRKFEGIRWPKFDERAIEIIKEINTLTRDEKSRPEIKAILLKNYSPVYDADMEGEKDGVTTTKHLQQQPDDKQITTTTIQQTGLIVREQQGLVDMALTTIQRQRELLEIKEQEITRLKTELSTKRIQRVETLDETPTVRPEKPKRVIRRVKPKAKPKPATVKKSPDSEKPKKKGFLSWITG